jgi:hypothetical protein
MQSRSKVQRIFEMSACSDSATMQSVPRDILLAGGDPSA